MNTFEIVGCAFVGAAVGFVAGGAWGAHHDRNSSMPFSALVTAPCGAAVGALAGAIYGAVKFA